MRQWLSLLPVTDFLIIFHTFYTFSVIETILDAIVRKNSSHSLLQQPIFQTYAIRHGAMRASAIRRHARESVLDVFGS